MWNALKVGLVRTVVSNVRGLAGKEGMENLRIVRIVLTPPLQLQCESSPTFLAAFVGSLAPVEVIDRLRSSLRVRRCISGWGLVIAN